MTDAAALPADPARPAGAWGVGIATISTVDGRVLDTWYPTPALGQPDHADLRTANGDDGSVTTELSPEQAAELLGVAIGGPGPTDGLRQVRRAVVATVIADLDAPPTDAHDVYLRLHLLSHCLVRPNAQNLDGIFGLLNNVVWTSVGPCAIEGFEQTRLKLRAAGHQVTVWGVDKFPRMIDYVVPAGVRIADANRVRMGAHLSPGTTVMHEGFCNFNAGTLGTSMVEGRISAGVVVGEGSDIGGGSSIQGTLSGGGKTVISIGEGCLLGANAGLGISLGDRCTVQAGCYILGGTRVTTPDGQVVKAAELSGRSDLLFRQNSTTGAMEVLSQTVDWGSLNADLHAN